MNEAAAGDGSFLPSADLVTLRRRAILTQAVRTFFDRHGYWEVETPLLSRDICVDAWIDPFCLQGDGDGTLYLQTSPEFAMKRLLAAGADAIWQLTRSFRRGETGQYHNPEFAMLEWYRVGDDHHAQMTFVEALVRHVATQAVEFGAEAAPLSRLTEPIRRLRYDEAFAEFAGSSVLQLEVVDLAELARTHDLVVPASLQQGEGDRDDWLNLLLAEIVEPALASLGAVFLYDYPASQAALAKVSPGPPPVAERFELYLDGIEICNGYHELTEADELARRMQQQSDRRVAAGLPALPVESRLLQAMRKGLPNCAGVALGLDRLLMWALGAETLADVMPFPFDRC
ncbi:Elongation factor P--(R)-beta-lysine ligase [Maioricimonas rarisocia]|uniref:Elongation factor P--(R)-beta-lysine ligase n=1 Tax=Maioricimonas rarisocia TaxID=2528026 RepID=A0A517Z087_9PLAN|nr:EF-P lysine aminoacylase EpmA [Maioricimonas rarisocia]QDU35900.1 Elongation factor P--(R)-beta-lysine ligase [Maioricimonas rarisocia]